MDDISVESLDRKKADANETKGLKTIPPGFSRGLRLPGDPVEDEDLVTIEGDETSLTDGAENEVSLALYIISRLLTALGLCDGRSS